MQLPDRTFRRTNPPALAPVARGLAQGLFSGLLATLLASLAACSPRYDWREQRPEGAGWSASFPARIQAATRAIRLDGIDLTMAMVAAEVGEATFAIGVADLPADVPAASAAGSTQSTPLSERIKDAAKTAMLRNIGATVTREASAKLLRSEKNLAPIDALALEADGRVANAPVRLAARFAVVPVAGDAQRQRIVQMLVLGPQSELYSARGREAIETFMTSIRLD